MEKSILTLPDEEKYMSRVQNLARSQGFHDIVGSLSDINDSSTKALYIDHHQRR